MATDEALHNADEDSPAIWAPVYAWRALGQLRVEEAIAPLIGLLRRADLEYGDDWVLCELPGVFGAIGKPALEPLAVFFADEKNGLSSRAGAADSLVILGKNDPALRLECIEVLSRQLRAFATQSDEFNGFIVGALMDLSAVEALPVIREAFATGAVDEMIVGDIENVEIKLGIREPRPDRVPNFASLEDGEEPESVPMPFIAEEKTGRNEPCPCKSGKKYKKCCGK